MKNYQTTILLGACCLGGFILGLLIHWAQWTFQNREQGVEWNGGTFYGDMVGGQPDGYGRFEKDDEIYSGYWVEGNIYQGTVESPHGIYEGELKLNPATHGFLRDGYGVAHYKDGRTYWGYWKDDMRHGLGRQVKGQEMVFGTFQKGVYVTVQGQQFDAGQRVYGIDVSHHQGTIDWQDLYFSANADGTLLKSSAKTGNRQWVPQISLSTESAYKQPVLFALIRATYGSQVKDRCFEQNFVEARRCGVARGAYHFLTSEPIQEQFENFRTQVLLEPGDFPPILDLEKNEANGAVSDADFRPIVAMAKQWLEKAEDQWHVKPIIYTNKTVYETFIKNDPVLKQYDLWVCRLDNTAPEKYLFWQFSHKGHVGGVAGNAQGEVDVDLFNGTYTDMTNYLARYGYR